MLTCYISKLFIWFNTILPSSCKNSRNFSVNHKTKDFPIFHLWISKNFKKLNFYGCNNVLYYSDHKNTKQMVPICSAVITMLEFMSLCTVQCLDFLLPCLDECLDLVFRISFSWYTSYRYIIGYRVSFKGWDFKDDCTEFIQFFLTIMISCNWKYYFILRG